MSMCVSVCACVRMCMNVYEYVHGCVSMGPHTDKCEECVCVNAIRMYVGVCSSHIHVTALDVKGLFRVPSSNERVKDIIQRFDKGINHKSTRTTQGQHKNYTRTTQGLHNDYTMTTHFTPIHTHF